jgi:hypothetical protein
LSEKEQAEVIKGEGIEGAARFKRVEIRVVRIVGFVGSG